MNCKICEGKHRTEDHKYFERLRELCSGREMITITDVKVVGICSKCRDENDEVTKWKDGKIVEDKDLSCIGCAIGLKKCEVEKE